MRAVAIVEQEPAGGYEIQDLPEPSIGPRELLIAVRAAALNRADMAQREGRYRQAATAADGPRIAGLEAAGEVTAVGPAVRRWRVGDRAMAMCSGGFAEYVAVDERLALPVPDRLDWAAAAATPVALLTGHDAIVTRAGLRGGESVVVHGAGSAVGLMAVQIARLRGARPLLATATSALRSSLIRGLGADEVLTDPESFLDAATERTEAGVDVAIDFVGAEYFAANVAALAVGGRLVSVGRLGGTRAEVDLDLFAAKNLTCFGVSFRTRSLARWAEVTRRAAADLLPALADGQLDPVLDRILPLEQLQGAEERMIANRHQGKIVLTLRQD